MEIWLPVWDFDGYEVSDLGGARSLDRWIVFSDGRRRFFPGQTLVAPPDGQGYPRVYVKRLRRGFTIHIAVLTAFRGPCPEGEEALHADDDKLNAALTNLSWGTRSQNQLDRVRNGLNPNANKTHCDYGHEFDEANTYYNPARGGRQCRKCMVRWQHEYQARKREMVS